MDSYEIGVRVGALIRSWWWAFLGGGLTAAVAVAVAVAWGLGWI